MAGTADRWLVVGADGGIGRALLARLRADGRPAVGTTRRTGGGDHFLDLSADPAGWTLPDGVAVAYLCAAVTSIDACRRDPAGTNVVNVDRTLALAARLRGHGAHLVFLSTNQVFDGTAPARGEGAEPCPRTEYGRQKAAVEAALLAAGGATVVRLTKVVPPRVPLLCEWAAALRAGEPVAPFRDMVMSPVPLGFVAEALARVGQTRPGGVIQVSGDCDVTYARLAARLAARLGAPAGLVRPVAAADRGLTADAAPANTTLGTARLAGLGLTPPAVWDTTTDLLEEAVR